MISNKTLKEYDFNSIYQYYEMILESLINGNINQVKEQAKKLNKAQKIEFINYLPEICADANDKILFFTHLFIN